MLGAMSGDGKAGRPVRRPRAIGRPPVPPGLLADLKALLYELYLQAGTPTLDEMAAWVAADDELAGAPGRDAIGRVIGDAVLPGSQADVVAVVTVLARAARWDCQDAAGRARDLWVGARMAAARSPADGIRVSEADPRRLGAHAAISVPGVPDEVPPEYVPRDADDGEFGVRAKVTAAARRGGFVLLVGGSSVGKTRCAFEAVKELLPEWWLVHPAGPDEVAALAAAPVPLTVLWLDELQRYLDGEHGLTAAVVRALLNAPDPVVIIGTLWPKWYADYTAVPAPSGGDPRARERQLLEQAEVVRIGEEFSPAEQDRAAAARDPRLKIALETGGYGLTQTLAAAPQLVARWEDARTGDPYAWAVLTAALDATRLGARAPLTTGFLRAAAPGYCTSQQQAEAPDNWFEQALAYATGKLHGAAAALSPAGAGMGQIAGYTAADYLIQHATRERFYARVPASAWDAIVRHTQDRADAARLAYSARKRLRYRYAIPLYRLAADADDEFAAVQLAKLLGEHGDLDGLRDLADHHREAVSALAELLAERGDLDRLRDLADHHREAVSALVKLLAERGDLDELRDLADHHREAVSALAELLAERGDLDRLRDLADHHREAVSALVKLLAERGDVDELRDLADHHWEAVLVLAGVLAERAELDAAEQVLRAGTEANWRVVSALVKLLGERGDVDGLRDLADHHWEAVSVLAGVLAERGDLDAAEQVLRTGAKQVLRTGTDSAPFYWGHGQPYLRLGELMAEHGDPTRAEQVLREGVVHYWEAALALAKLLAQRGDLDTTEQVLRAQVERSREAASALAMEFAASGELAGIEEILREQDWHDWEAVQWLAGLLAERGDLDAAEQVLHSRAKIGDPRAASALAGLLAERGDLDAAKQLVRAWAERSWDPVLALADSLAKRGDLGGLRTLADAGEGRADLMADLLIKQGRDEEAERVRRFGLNPDGSTASS